jgi:hypothetical protein
MGSLLGGVLNGLSTFATTGNPYIATGVGLATALGGGSGTANGALGNAAMSTLNGQQEAFQTMMYAEQIRHDEQMQLQSEAFDEMMDQKSENMRQQNTLRDVDMAQRKADNAITKKFIESINE